MPAPPVYWEQAFVICAGQEAADHSAQPPAPTAPFLSLTTELAALTLELLFLSASIAQAHSGPLTGRSLVRPSAANSMAGGGGSSIASRRAGAPVMAQCSARQAGRSSHGPVLPSSSACEEAVSA